MVQPKIIIDEDQGPFIVLDRLRSNQLESAFMVSESGKYLGTIDAQNIVQTRWQIGMTIRAIARTGIQSVLPGAVVENLLPIAAGTSHPIPVVDEEGNFLGQVNQSDLLLSLIQTKNGKNVNNLPVVPPSPATEAEHV